MMQWLWSMGAVASLSGRLLFAGEPGGAVDYAEPRFLPGRICELGPSSGKCLFQSERRSTSTGDTVRVTCDYTYPDGRLAAQDRILYRSGRLLSFEEDEFQTGTKGSATIYPDLKVPGKWRIDFQFSAGQGATRKTTRASERLDADTLVDDMIPAFIVSHWDTLESGAAAKFRYIVLDRKETVGFKLVKEGETSRYGQTVVKIRMEPTSFIIARLVDPLSFVVEKDGGHRILEYRGRTTPLVREGTKWKELDALSVFDWGQQQAGAGAASNLTRVPITAK